jgi:hypothetical protein
MSLIKNAFYNSFRFFFIQFLFDAFTTKTLNFGKYFFLYALRETKDPI